MADEQTNGTQEPARAKPKKEKPPVLEDKPFDEFIRQHYLPTLQQTLEGQGLEDLYLDFVCQRLPVKGLDTEDCWQVVGRWQNNKRQFNVYFMQEDIKGQKAFSCADSGSTPSTIEPFLGDERRISLELLVFGVTQRLNAEKWLARN